MSAAMFSATLCACCVAICAVGGYGRFELGHKDGIGTVFGKKIYGRNAAFMKKVIDNKHFFELKKIGLAIKKGKF